MDRTQNFLYLIDLAGGQRYPVLPQSFGLCVLTVSESKNLF